MCVAAPGPTASRSVLARWATGRWESLSGSSRYANTCSCTLPSMSDPNFSQRIVLRTLLAAHPRMLGLDELVAQLADVPRVREALRVLTDDGLAMRLGDRVGVSRAAVRFDALAPI
jgi:hypothetical protein